MTIKKVWFFWTLVFCVLIDERNNIFGHIFLSSSLSTAPPVRRRTVICRIVHVKIRRKYFTFRSVLTTASRRHVTRAHAFAKYVWATENSLNKCMCIYKTQRDANISVATIRSMHSQKLRSAKWLMVAFKKHKVAISQNFETISKTFAKLLITTVSVIAICRKKRVLIEIVIARKWLHTLRGSNFSDVIVVALLSSPFLSGN